ncbi:MAG: universal stress protein [Mycobacterium pseudokansasii]|uniref:Universal stress protein n=1 Tax=Mycobacterium pseudokansasii TaxID=2341080 RepID=A0A498QVK9_9MYCO|nr:universal stress protein [Mycobacterium pseudokansasii]KZS61950.1 universal stress protein [Mycobacterium kansasii]MBY0386698.1 universal stress protein [Mycobacterium pseudokansasii]VAZ97617.1 Universal stress protein [Mycobacterium pseudokansasii]VAZ99068.1 Universal stress protein [Mycobacterium pseudokansasii]VBA52622.1 Universal stress protein [Mycobacterium pseudokansasii]
MSTTMKRLGIVVGVDGSAASNAAVSWAAQDATLRHLPLTLVHMVNAAVPMWPEMPMAMGMAAWQEEDGRQVLEQAVKIAEEAVQAHREITIHSELRWSPPVPTLVELSAEAELVVVGSYGRGAVARAVLGSVGSALLRRANCPVAVVRDPDPAAADPAHRAQLQQAPVVVGIDGSPVSELATAIAFDEASRRGVELKAVHAWSDLEVVDLPGLDWATVKAEAEQTVAERLAGWQERYPDVTVHRLVVCDRPARELIDQAQSAQLVVLGSHGRGGFTGMLLGSVSNAVVHSVRTPVIVARPS